MKWSKATRIGSIVLIVVLFGLILAFTDVEKTIRAFVGIRWGWAVWVICLNLLNTFVEALRLSFILFPLTSRYALRNSFNSALVAIIGNVMLPLRFGDGARAYYIAKTEKLSLSSSFSTLMLDRVSDLALFFALMALTALMYPFPPSVMKMGLVAGAIFAVVLLAIFALAQVGLRMGRGSPGKIRRRISREVGNFLHGLSVMRNAGLLLPILLCSAVSWCLRGAMIWCMFHAFSLSLAFAATPVTLILLNFGIAVVNTPANLGGFELAVVGALQLFSVQIEVALSYAVALHAIEVVPMVVFGIIFLWLEGLKTGDVLKSMQGMQHESQEVGSSPANLTPSSDNR
jgi:uncharacterized protein (TIRG00374 family)